MFDLASNWGTEDGPEVKYHNGNSEPKGFGECELCGTKALLHVSITCGL